jgi:hypothetical protein
MAAADYYVVLQEQIGIVGGTTITSAAKPCSLSDGVA